MDANGDGLGDLIVGDANGVLHLFLNTGTKDAPKLGAARPVLVGGEPFKWAGDRIKPEVVDWNNDGLFDLVLGEERGKVLLLLNTGTNAEYVFEEAVPLRDGDAELKVWMRGDPAVADWNGDGKKDLLVADESGKISYFENRGTDAAPAFDGSEMVQARGWPISPGTSSYFRRDVNGDGRAEVIAPDNTGAIVIYLGRERKPLEIGGTAFKSEHGRLNIGETDWNEDGLFDILISEKSGAISVAVNTGTEAEAKFGVLLALQAGEEPVNGGTGASARVEDIDGDGRADLVCYDENGDLRCFKNVGEKGAPVLEAIETPERSASEICGGYRSRLDVADWNSDGKLDIVYGVTSYKDSKCRVYVFLRP